MQVFNYNVDTLYLYVLYVCVDFFYRTISLKLSHVHVHVNVDMYYCYNLECWLINDIMNYKTNNNT